MAAPNTSYLITGQRYTFFYKISGSLGGALEFDLTPIASKLSTSGINVKNVSATRGFDQDTVAITFIYSGGPGNRIDGFAQSIQDVLSQGFFGTAYQFIGADFGIQKPKSDLTKYALYAGIFIVVTAFLFALGKGIGGGLVA